MVVPKEKFKVYKNVFSDYTNKNLQKLCSQGYLDLDKMIPLSIGKESNVFLSESKNAYVIVKIYRVENCDFLKMYDYLKFDDRYIGIKKQKRKIIFLWCQREYRNLLRAREIGANVPTPYTFKDNIIIMESIGQHSPAPRLKDSLPKNKNLFFTKVIDNMRKLYKHGLVHGDLSEFNILNLNEEPYFIDFSQATLKKSLNFNELFQRDINNIARYFTKIGLKVTAEKIKEMIINE